MDYTFYLQTDASPLAIQQQISRATSGAPWRDGAGEPAEPISVLAAIPAARRMVARSYGFEPDVIVSVQLDKFVDDRREREAEALDTLRVLLDHNTGDLCADYYDGNLVLMRRNGLVSVQANWLKHRPWISEHLAPAGTMTSTVL